MFLWPSFLPSFLAAGVCLSSEEKMEGGGIRKDKSLKLILPRHTQMSDSGYERCILVMRKKNTCLENVIQPPFQLQEILDTDNNTWLILSICLVFLLKACHSRRLWTCMHTHKYKYTSIHTDTDTHTHRQTRTYTYLCLNWTHTPFEPNPSSDFVAEDARQTTSQATPASFSHPCFLIHSCPSLPAPPFHSLLLFCFHSVLGGWKLKKKNQSVTKLHLVGGRGSFTHNSSPSFALRLVCV